MKKNILATLTGALLASATAMQAVELPDIFSDHAVLQQQSDALLWGWAKPGAKVKVTPSWDNDTRTVTADSKSGRFEVRLSTPSASYTPYTITFDDGTAPATLSDILVGEVWFCSGQSNMEMPLRGFGIQPIEGAAQAIAYSGKYPGVRMATVPKRQSYTVEDRAEGKWQVSSPANAPEFSALAYFFARSLNDILNVPVGIVQCSYGGSKLESWLPKEVLDTYPGYDMEAEKNDTTVDPWHRIGVLYNGMLNPVKGYTVKGFLWNQGESNVGKHDEYPHHQKEMVELWRKLWGNPDLPFYFVELPPWSYGDGEGRWAAYFREGQHKAAEITPNSGIVCTTDLAYPYELEDVHASQKQPIGERLAFMAAARTYGIKGMPHIYPQYKSMETKDGKAILSFTNSTGGLNPNLNLEGFEVAGDDHVFHPATAVEDWNNYTITVSSPEVPEVKAVRYCFKNFAIGKLKDMLGLPLVPFRTDNWDVNDATTAKPHNEP
ncbi:MAG: sialate O-acetylesterase [Muribaculaceae bacterium]|nr:sialate O-acetylesterase [Muribaculaceae bacterium]